MSDSPASSEPAIPAHDAVQPSPGQPACASSLAADPEIAASCSSVPQTDCEIEALLDFEPVPRRIEVPGGWSPEKQREVIARLAVHGSANRACDEMGMHRTGLTKVYKSPWAKSFRAAWDAAVALATRRREEQARAGYVAPGATPPTLDGRRKHKPGEQDEPLPGQLLNEHGEWEDADSIRRRAEDARDSISQKLLNSRRLYLREISASPGKRAAFEILTELPIDWDKAARLEPQADEPWNRANQRQRDMILTAENGWSFGECGYGPDKKAELRAAVDAHRAEEGLDPVDWDESAECKDTAAQQHVDLHERREASSADGSRSEPDRRHVGFTPRDEPSSPSPSPTPPKKPGPRLRGL